MELTFEIFGEKGDFSGSARLAPGHNLSACPFCCGHDVEAVNTWTPSYWVQCRTCGAEGPHRCLTDKVSFATVGAAKRAHRTAIQAAINAWDERL